MNCRRFRKLHNAFIDGRVSDREAQEIYAHLEVCARCARLNAVIRRGLLVARNLPPVHVSSGFMSRLQARLRGRDDTVDTADDMTTGRRALRVGAAILVIGAGIAGAHGIERAHRVEDTTPAGHTGEVSVPSVASQRAAPATGAEKTPQFGIDLASGIPIWSGVFVAEQAADHLASTELERTDLSP